MKKIEELFSLCKASVMITYNENKDMYQSVGQYLNEQHRRDDLNDIDMEVLKVMLDKNQMVTIRAYPNTPISFYIVHHWDLESALDAMLEAIKKAIKEYD